MALESAASMGERAGSFGAAAARIAVAVATVLVVLPSVGSGAPRPRDGTRTPVVLFPAFHLTKLLVTVRNQSVAPECPRSGTFEDWFLNDHPSTTFSGVRSS